MTTSSIISEVDAFVAAQNKNRGGSLAAGGVLPFDYDALTGTVPAGGNAVTGISGIAASAAGITLPSAQTGNAVIIDGGISTAASTSGPDAYSLYVDANGLVTVTDNNTGNAQTVTGASYLLFNGAATTSTGAYQSLYIIETGNAAVLASMYNAALGRIPDLPGLEFYIDQFGTTAVPDLHTAAIFFENSPEFKQDYPALQTASDNGGPNDQAFITQLYSGILHRTPTASEVTFYAAYMQGNLNGQTGPGNRADLLIYFANSPENQADIAASSGGWLINPANGAVNFGALNNQATQTLLTKETASGTVNASDFASISNGTLEVDVKTSTGYVTFLEGKNPLAGAGAELGTNASNITINLSSAINVATVDGQGDIINGAPTGGSLIHVADDNFTSPANNYGGTVNLFGNHNTITSGEFILGGNVNVPTIINGWNSTDTISLANLNAPGGAVYNASTSNPLAGSSISYSITGDFNPQVAINLGTVANDSVGAMVALANGAYKVSDAQGENAYFFAEDPQGNTLVYHWRGDTTGVHQILAADINGAIELVGVHASSLTSSNFI